MIRTAIIDDEALARKRVRRLLLCHNNLQVVGEADCGKTGRDLILHREPDIVILDIDMPWLSGFEILTSGLPKRPAIIFSTAYPNFAVKAFEVDAADYLLKPYDQARFSQAITKAIGSMAEPSSASSRREYLSKLDIAVRGIRHLVDLDRVYYVEAYGNYLKLHTAKGCYVYRSTMSRFQDQLDPKKFVRIHRSFLVNMICVESIRYLAKGEYEVLLENGCKLHSGRKYQDGIARCTKVEVGF